MRITSALLLLTSSTNAHFVFRNTVIRSVTTEAWTNVRKTANYLTHDPLTDVTSKLMTCYQLASGNEGAKTTNVTAGDTVGFGAYPSVLHAGPTSFWMAKAPASQTADTMTGDGQIWFKVQQEYPTQASGQLTWPSQGKTIVNVQIPKCIPNGDYLLRAEHIGLDNSSPYLFLSCAQITVTGGSGSIPNNLVSIPGVYSPKDPGLTLNPGAGKYTPPGPAPLVCG